LIIRTDRIGDLVLSTPSFTALKNKFPKAYISLVVNNYTKELVVNNPMIDKVITCDSETSLFDKLRFILDLRRRHFDLIVVLHSTFWPCAISFLSGALFRIGYKERGCGFLLTTPIPPKKGDEIVHEVEKTLDIVRVIGADIEAKELYIGVTEQGERYAETFFREMGISSRDKIVAIHPGASNDSEEHLVEDILRLIKNKKEVIPTGDTTLTQLVSLLKRCNLFIGNSTGPMHMAAALNIPVVAIFGCINPLDNYKRWGPWGNGHIIVSKDLNCPDCHPSDCKTFDCMRLITPKEVLAAASNQMRDK
jgi:ADP-heptose:LPS heptosyltransferase